ncbi:heavy-metal-associated domain-containing protein [Paraburkholderia sp. JHI869]|uniref:heavy-metal-associated domain-containing protein n=1 Tax=Paraburkholderia sp. JHI869 TaxID=3112959 RepID=UPI00317B338F
MIVFEVNDMTCDHCVVSVTNALKFVDSHAKFTVDLARHLVTIEPTNTDPNKFGDAITDAGYTPVLVEGGTINACTRAKSCCEQQQ